MRAEKENLSCGAAQFRLNGTGLVYYNSVSIQNPPTTQLLLSENAKLKGLNISSLQVNEKTLFAYGGSKMPLEFSNTASKKRFGWEG